VEAVGEGGVEAAVQLVVAVIGVAVVVGVYSRRGVRSGTRH
jgi:hypothetical protein